MRRGIVAVLGALMVFAAVAPAGAQRWNFDDEKVGEIAKDFSNESGEWRIRPDSTAPSPPRVLAQEVKNERSVFNLTLLGGRNFKDVDVSVAMKPIEGKEDPGGGLVWRAADALNFYVARYNPSEDNYRLYKVVKGNKQQIRSAYVKHVEGWQHLRVTMTGDRIECYYGGNKVMEVTDLTFPGTGKVGLWTMSDALCHFDDFTVAGGR